MFSEKTFKWMFGIAVTVIATIWIVTIAATIIVVSEVSEHGLEAVIDRVWEGPKETQVQDNEK